MRAVVYEEYGPPEVLQLKALERPIPKEDEVRIKVHAAAVTFGETKARDFRISPSEFWLPLPLLLPARLEFGLREPRHPILGAEFAGEVDSLGEGITQFNKGDQVFGFSSGFGANAEYLYMPEHGALARKPVNMSFEQAAVVPHGAMTALHFMRKAEIRPGEKVLINGASGGIGQFAVQLAKAFGAEVTGTCSTPKMELVRSLGADQVLDYTQQDFTQNGQTYDVIFDTAVVTSFAKCRESMAENGRYLLAVFGMRELVQMLWTGVAGGKKVICDLATINKERLNDVKELIEAGEVRAVIDRSFPLEQIAEAHRYVESGQKKGYVVITVG